MAPLLRALSLLRLLGSVQAAKLRVAAAARDTAQLAALYVVAAIILFIAVLFLLLALFLALASVWPPHWAAFAVFVLLLVLVAMIVLYARQRPRRRFFPPAPTRSQAASEGVHAPPPDTETDEISSAIRSGIRRHPLAVTLGAIAVGLVLGLASRRDDT